jgi:hypothetical protein
MLVLNKLTIIAVKKKRWAHLQRIIELFTQKIFIKLSKKMGLGSGIRDPGKPKNPIPDPGSRGQIGTRSLIRICNTAFKGK